MRSGQERMEKGQEEMKGLIDEVKSEVQRKIDEVEEKVQMKIEDVKSEVQGKIEEVEHKVQGKIGDIERRLSELEIRPFSFSSSPEFMHSRPTTNIMDSLQDSVRRRQLYKWMDGFCESQSTCGIAPRISCGGSSRNSS
ncbi:hypothetical protein AVEN_52087-1 [Araneus ventricosus]|uniref:Uncharacterized protein n=1 Tax=Araneus ventricosus TaxID=182803 RepID=A0A4Y2UDK0_ARAVE|nr:hypothetical protein AVEN_52087-1 [Araneus ventricosus]